MVCSAAVAEFLATLGTFEKEAFDPRILPSWIGMNGSSFWASVELPGSREAYLIHHPIIWVPGLRVNQGRWKEAEEVFV
jgi:hypothetical protein